MLTLHASPQLPTIGGRLAIVDRILPVAISLTVPIFGPAAFASVFCLIGRLSQAQSAIVCESKRCVSALNAANSIPLRSMGLPGGTDGIDRRAGPAAIQRTIS